MCTSPALSSALTLQVESLLHIRLLSHLPVPILDVLLLDKAGHHQGGPHADVLWLHGNGVVCLLHFDRHHWILQLLHFLQVGTCFVLCTPHSCFAEQVLRHTSVYLLACPGCVTCFCPCRQIYAAVKID